MYFPCPWMVVILPNIASQLRFCLSAEEKNVRHADNASFTVYSRTYVSDPRLL